MKMAEMAHSFTFQGSTKSTVFHKGRVLSLMNCDFAT